ncbi:M16 family metallopeptidase [Anaeromyxobacter oryzae]|uniref:Insulinase family protein n=1 Tax=Anaeromyxobacter oryzae TaxID=2918170 RepID=A0ABN6MS66_9BACT|nr:M16 family metallopeptidase [Anaeromyxobacter oryzae]BDG03786.1 hypothetical protein AMOR_27820 [Anaeromyxobacter oryzae]
MTRRLRAAVLASVAVVSISCAARPRYVRKGDPIPYKGSFATFPSGLQVVVYEVPQVDRFSVTVSYGAGSAEDPSGKEGLAHAVEHLSYRARPYWSRDARIEDKLAEPGFVFDAATYPDSTDYWVVGRPRDLRRALALEAARLREPLGGVTEDDLATERDVLVSEYRERSETDPRRTQLAWLQAAAFRDHPYGRPSAGTPASIRGLTLEDARRWASRLYRPENAILVITSPRKASDVLGLVAQVFGDAIGDRAPAVPVARRVPAPPPIRAEDLAPVTRLAPVARPVVWVAWRVPGDGAQQHARAEYTALALHVAFAGKLVLSARGTLEELVDDFDVQLVPLAAAGLIVLRAELVRAEDAERVIDLAKSAAFELRAQDEFRTGSRRALGNDSRLLITTIVRDTLLVDGYRAVERVDGSTAARHLRATGDADYLAAHQHEIVEQLKDVPTDYAAEHLRREQAFSLVVLPDPTAVPPVEPAPDRVAEHDPAPDDAAAPGADADAVRATAGAPGLVAAARRVLPNGLTVLVARRGAFPLAEVRLVVRTTAEGGAAVPAGLPVLALEASSGGFAWGDLARIGASGTTSLGRESLTFVARGTSANLDVLLESTAEWARDQRDRWFDQISDGYERWVGRREADLDVAARRALERALYPGHPYGAAPTAEGVHRLRSGDVSRWLSAEIRPERATLVVVSDQEPSPELWAAIEDHFGGWSRGDRPRAALEAPPLPAARHVVLVDRPGATQAVVVAALRAPPAAGRDAAATNALAAWLARRLDRILREGGVSSGLSIRIDDHERGAALIARTAVAPDVAARTIRTILDAARALADAPLSPADAARARFQVARAFAFRFDTVDGAATALATAAVLDLPSDHWDAQPASIATLSPERIQEAAAALGIGREVILVVGDAASLRPQLEAAGFAVECVNSRGR